MIVGDDVTWTAVIVHLIYGLPAIIAALYAASVRRQIRTPSGERAGSLIEKTHDLNVVQTRELHALNGYPAEEPEQP